jgi:hypothetical protein
MTHSARARASIVGTHLVFVGVLMASTTAVLAQTSPVETIVVTSHRSEDTLAGYTGRNPIKGAGAGTPLYWTQRGRSALGSMAIKL